MKNSKKSSSERRQIFESIGDSSTLEEAVKKIAPPKKGRPSYKKNIDPKFKISQLLIPQAETSSTFFEDCKKEFEANLFPDSDHIFEELVNFSFVTLGLERPRLELVVVDESEGHAYEYHQSLRRIFQPGLSTSVNKHKNQSKIIYDFVSLNMIYQSYYVTLLSEYDDYVCEHSAALRAPLLSELRKKYIESIKSSLRATLRFIVNRQASQIIIVGSTNHSHWLQAFNLYSIYFSHAVYKLKNESVELILSNSKLYVPDIFHDPLMMLLARVKVQASPMTKNELENATEANLNHWKNVPDFDRNEKEACHWIAQMPFLHNYQRELWNNLGLYLEAMKDPNQAGYTDEKSELFIKLIISLARVNTKMPVDEYISQCMDELSAKIPFEEISLFNSSEIESYFEGMFRNVKLKEDWDMCLRTYVSNISIQDMSADEKQKISSMQNLFDCVYLVSPLTSVSHRADFFNHALFSVEWTQPNFRYHIVNTLLNDIESPSSLLFKNICDCIDTIPFYGRCLTPINNRPKENIRTILKFLISNRLPFFYSSLLDLELTPDQILNQVVSFLVFATESTAKCFVEFVDSPLQNDFSRFLGRPYHVNRHNKRKTHHYNIKKRDALSKKFENPQKLISSNLIKIIERDLENMKTKIA